MFSLTDEQQRRATEWVETHDCTISHVGAIGGKITYTFTPTSLGVVENVVCECGKNIDLTDYDEW